MLSKAEPAAAQMLRCSVRLPGQPALLRSCLQAGGRVSRGTAGAGPHSTVRRPTDVHSIFRTLSICFWGSRSNLTSYSDAPRLGRKD